MPVLFLILFPFRLLQNIEPSSLCYIVDTCWLSIYLFKIQWYVPVNPRLPIYSRSHLFPWVTVSLLSKSMSLFLFCLSSFASLFLTYWLLHYGCLSLTSLSMIISRSIHVAANGIQFSSVAQSCLTLCDPMDDSAPGFLVHHQLPQLAQTHVHQVNDAIQPSHPLSSPFLPAFNLSQHQGLFQWVSSSHQMTKVLELQLQHQFFQWIFRTDFL